MNREPCQDRFAWVSPSVLFPPKTYAYLPGTQSESIEPGFRRRGSITRRISMSRSHLRHFITSLGDAKAREFDGGL
jgi:hypothetical protein